MVQLWTRDEYHTSLNGQGIIGRDGCPFCDLDGQNEYVLWKWKHWFLCHNKFPYSGNDQHIMALPFSHKVFFTELDTDELLELWEVHVQVKAFYGEKNYFSCTRETLGDWERDARSIEHLHIHFVPGKLEGKYLRKMLEHQGFPIQEEKLEMKDCKTII